VLQSAEARILILAQYGKQILYSPEVLYISVVKHIIIKITQGHHTHINNKFAIHYLWRNKGAGENINE
jgi:hypothetical protein